VNQVMACYLESMAQLCVVEDESGNVLEEAQPFSYAIAIGINDTKRLARHSASPSKVQASHLPVQPVSFAEFRRAIPCPCL